MKNTEDLAMLIRKAYNLIDDAPTTDIDVFYSQVKQAQAFIAEALDLADWMAGN